MFLKKQCWVQMGQHKPHMLDFGIAFGKIFLKIFLKILQKILQKYI
jgi:hypothetical protein